MFKAQSSLYNTNKCSHCMVYVVFKHGNNVTMVFMFLSFRSKASSSVAHLIYMRFDVSKAIAEFSQTPYSWSVTLS